MRLNLERLPGLLADLTDSYTRQTRLGESSGGRKTSEAPVPFDAKASACHDTVSQILARMVSELSTAIDTQGLAWNPRAHTNWLHLHLREIRRMPAAVAVADAVWDCVIQIRRVVDLPRDRVHFGACPVCAHEVFGWADDMTTVCGRCALAGIETRVVQQDWTDTFWQDAPDALVSRRDALEALALYNLPTNPRTFASWVERQQLTRQPDPDNPDRVVYRFGDVLALAKANTRRPGRPAKTTRQDEEVASTG